MIQITNAEISGFEAAVRGMRNPMNSWDKSDSKFGLEGWNNYIGENDLALMKKLSKSGSDHAKYLRMIGVSMDINAPLYWWKEFDTYKVGTVANSCSTMHKIHEKFFTIDDFSHEHLDPMYALPALENTIVVLNIYRNSFLEHKRCKDYWWQMIQLLPSSYNQKRTVVLNYAVLKNMYHARKNHKLDEWRDFCKWIEQLPYSEVITEC